MSEHAPGLLRLLVRLYPRAIRAGYADAMLAFYAERFAEARRRGESPLRVWRRTLVDLVASLGAEWLRSVQSLRPRRRGGGAGPRVPTTDRQTREDVMDALAKEVAYAIRALGKSGAFSLAAVVTLALGIGSTTAIFSVVDSVLLRPLPFPRVEQLVVPQSRDRATGETWSVTYADFMDWRDQRVFERVAVYQNTEVDLTGTGEPVRVSPNSRYHSSQGPAPWSFCRWPTRVKGIFW